MTKSAYLYKTDGTCLIVPVGRFDETLMFAEHEHFMDALRRQMREEGERVEAHALGVAMTQEIVLPVITRFFLMENTENVAIYKEG